jgi:hypothetical protein
VQVGVERSADVEAWRALLGELTARSGLRGDFLDAVAAGLRPWSLLEAVESQDVAAIERVDKALTAKTARATKLIDVLTASGRLHELETVRLADRPTLALKVDGGEAQPSETLSIGERCTCVLPLVFMQSATALLLDQPEDNVGNSYIYEVLIPTILERKRERQLLIATHNPNLIVLGDAERTFALAGGRWSGRLDAAGSVDEMREWIERYLEGGRKAFRKRAQRYGHLPPSTKKDEPSTPRLVEGSAS